MQRGVDNIRLLNAALVNDYVMLTYQRPLKSTENLDKSIITNGSQAVVWAVGPLSSNGEPSYHKLRNKGDLIIDFGRAPFWNCPAPEEAAAGEAVQPVQPAQQQPWTSLDEKEAEIQPLVGNYRPLESNAAGNQVSPQVSPKPWYIPAIECYEPENHVFYAHIGPSGGAQGYNAITRKYIGRDTSCRMGNVVPQSLNSVFPCAFNLRQRRLEHRLVHQRPARP